IDDGGRRARVLGAVVEQVLDRFWGEVEGRQREPGLHDVSGQGVAHVADADECGGERHCLPPHTAAIPSMSTRKSGWNSCLTTISVLAGSSPENTSLRASATRGRSSIFVM